MSTPWRETGPDTERVRSVMASYEWPLHDETVAAIDAWSSGLIINETNQAGGFAAAVVVLYARQKSAAALASGDVSLLHQASHAGLLLAHAPGRNPRAQAEGTDSRALLFVLDAAQKFELAPAAFVSNEPRIGRTLLAQAAADYSEWISRDSYLVVSRWGTPWLDLPWGHPVHETHRGRVHETSLPRDWPADRLPWTQTAPVLADEPSADNLQPAEAARRSATAFARTGDPEHGLASIRSALTARLEHPMGMALWAARHTAGDNGALQMVDLVEARMGPGVPDGSARPDVLPPGVVVTAFGGPTFDLVLAE